jgi:hypothetical protein
MLLPLIVALTLHPAGHLLEPGMRLLFLTGSSETFWHIDSVTRDTTLGGMHGCTRIVLRTSAERPAEVRGYCSDRGMLHMWEESSRTLRPLRPIAPGRTLDLRHANGVVSRYETGAMETDRVVGVEVQVLPTTVTTYDSDGRVIRRVRERYAPGLFTATTGVIERPDPDTVEGYRAELRFTLASIIRPGT